MNSRFNFHQPAIYYWILFTAAIVFFITAYNSHGYFHADEHYQIIEFAELKLGINIPSNLVWEYRAQIRPTLQPTICFLLLHFLKILHVTDPYALIFSLRILTAIIALFTIHHFIIYTQGQIQNKNLKIAYYVLSYFIWFVPFISVRCSSETWGGLFFLAALTFYFNPHLKALKFFLIGVTLACSFLCRFQMAFSSVGFFCWLILINKTSFNDIVKLIAGFLVFLAVGVLIDTWFYENLVFTPWNYFYTFYIDIINFKESTFGSSPWYIYLEEILHLPGYFLGIPIILAFIILIFTRPKNIFIWCILPFFIIHTLIPHKETRFLFPLVYLLAIVLVLGYEKLMGFLHAKIISLLNYCFIFLFFTFNLTGLVVFATIPAGVGQIGITRYIHYHYSEKPLNFIHSPYTNPYNVHGILTRPYQEKIWNAVEIENLCALSDSVIVPGKENLLIIRKADLQFGSCKSTIEENNFILKTQSIPPWIEWLNENIYKEFDNFQILQLYKKEKYSGNTSHDNKKIIIYK